MARIVFHNQTLLKRVLFGLLCVLAFHLPARANHVSGADLFYEHISGNTYRVSLVVYGNCDPNPATSGAFASLSSAMPRIKLFDSSTLVGTLILSRQGPAVDVTPVCSAQRSNTACNNPNATLPGIMRFTYTVVTTLPHTSANWIFLFEGQMGGGGTAQAGRYNGITNIVNAGSNIMALEAQLNNLGGGNSSPQFTTVPTPFYCINVAQQYNLGAYDVDGDSLRFALVPGLTMNGNNLGTVSYSTGYAATSPLSAATGSFSFSPSTGQMNFTPNNTQVSLVVQQVNEYRNGVFVGSAMREMNFVVLSNCNNTPASSKIDTTRTTLTSGGSVAGSNDFNICYGTDSTHFNIIALNAAKDTISVSVAGLPAGVQVSVDSSIKTQPIVTIFWSNTGAPPGSHTFYVTYKDNGCPLTSTQTMAYTIHVIRPNQLSAYLVAPTQCVHQAWVDFSISYGLVPRNVILSQSGNIVRSYRDSTGHFQDSLLPGRYDVEIRSDLLNCPTYTTLVVPDSGTYPNRPVVAPVFYCENDKAVPLTAIADSGAVLRWFSATGSFSSLAPTPRTDTVGIFFWTVDQRYKTCYSRRDTLQVYVTRRPIAAFTLPDKICLYDTATVLFAGKVGVGPILDYRWNFGGAGYTSGDSAGPWRLHWYDTGYKVITLQVDENKCSSFPFRDTLYVKQVPYAGFDVRDACQFDTAQISYNTQPPKGLQYAWNFDEGLTGDPSGPGPFAVVWLSPGVKNLSLMVDLDGCTDTRQRSLEIYPKPKADIDYEPTKLCMGDLIYMTGTGGGSYLWTSSDPQVHSSEQPTFTALALHPQTIRLIVTNQWNCRDTASEIISTVERCCRFSYPNAFTPNGDQHNDVFRIVTYGNQIQFELSIYNRWGERVFHGDNAKVGWDGTFRGHACETGTYFYHLTAECYTGQKEEHNGEIMLLR